MLMIITPILDLATLGQLLATRDIIDLEHLLGTCHQLLPQVVTSHLQEDTGILQVLGMKYVPVGNILEGVLARSQGTAHCLPSNVPDIPGRALKILEASLDKVTTVKNGCLTQG